VDADRIAGQINQHFMKTAGRRIARAASPGQVDVEVPSSFTDKAVKMIAQIEQIPVLFSHNWAPSASSVEFNGGSCEIRNSTFVEHGEAIGQGDLGALGGPALWLRAGQFTLESCQFLRNHFMPLDIGDFWRQRASGSIVDCDFAFNQGRAASVFASEVTIERCRFTQR